MFTEAHKKRHRPQSLDLTTELNNVTRIVSPGLTPLNEEMENTVRMSQRIEQQQRHLIAARQSSSPCKEEDSGEESERSEDKSETEQTEDTDKETTDKADSDLQDAPADTNNKENGDTNDSKTNSGGDSSPSDAPLDKLATPLGAKRLKRDYIPPPLSIPLGYSQPQIQSAPIRHQRLPYTAVSASFPQGRTHVRAMSYLQQQQQQPRYRPIVHPQFSSPVQPIPPVPRKRTVVSAKRAPTIDKVTDVYHGDFTRAAPISSQPLSAQREFFVRKNEPDDDRLPVSEDEVREMEEKYKQRPAEEGEVFGSINFMNESVFNFRIFNNRDVKTDEEMLAKARVKFLKICETSWNEFVGKRDES